MSLDLLILEYLVSASVLRYIIAHLVQIVCLIFKNDIENVAVDRAVFLRQTRINVIKSVKQMAPTIFPLLLFLASLLLEFQLLLYFLPRQKCTCRQRLLALGHYWRLLHALERGFSRVARLLLRPLVLFNCFCLLWRAIVAFGLADFLEHLPPRLRQLLIKQLQQRLLPLFLRKLCLLLVHSVFQGALLPDRLLGWFLAA